MKKFENGLSIVQLEERFEMTVAARNMQQINKELEAATSGQNSV